MEVARTDPDIPAMPQGKPIPPEEESPQHGARTCRVDEGGMLHLTPGQPFMVQPREPVALYRQFSLELHGARAGRTRLLEFGRHAVERRQRSGRGKPQTFNFLECTFISRSHAMRSRRGCSR